MSSLPESRKFRIPSSIGVGLVRRNNHWGMKSMSVWMADDETGRLESDGWITKWQFYTTSAGKIGFQVWRRVGPLRDKK